MFWTSGNWDFSASTGSVNAGNFAPGVTFNDNLVMTNAGTSTSLIQVATTGGIRVADGFALNLINSFLNILGAGVGNGLAGISGGTVGFVNVSSGSFLSSQFAAVGLNITVNGTSHFELRGSGDPLNSQTQAMRLFMAWGSRWTLPTINESYEQAFANSGSNTIFVNGNVITSSGCTSTAASNWLTYVAFNPAVAPALTSSFTATAIPEPTSMGLIGLGTVLCLARRRRTASCFLVLTLHQTLIPTASRTRLAISI